MIKIMNKKIGVGQSCFIIAEIGSNQNKNIDTAYKLIDMAFNAGVDAIKFQTLLPNDIAKADMPANAYGEFKYTKGKKYWHEVLSDFVLPFEWHKELFDYAKSKGLIVFSTPESLEAVEFLEKLNVPAYKVASMDITYVQLLERIGKTKKPVILSSGVAKIEDIYNSIDILKKNGSKDIALLHCVSDYPPQYEYVSLNMINYYKNVFNDVTIGFSDHCENNLLAGIAVALGANIIEKHITLDKNSYGPDHSFALDKGGLEDLVQTVRNAEKALPINDLLEERKLNKRCLYGRSLIIKRAMRKGEKIRIDDIEYKRPGTGIQPQHVEKVVGMILKKDILENHILAWEDFK